jgi:hypothetical protein
MRRLIVAGVFASLVVGGADVASAVFVDSMVNYVKRGHHRNAEWPWPYTCPDRIAAREPFEIMIRNGWRRQNLLGGHYFEPGTNKLNVAGELQVRWIMTQAPPARRQVFIEQSVDPNITEARLAEVRNYASRVAIDGRMPQVTALHLMAEGRPAATVDWTTVQFMEHMPPPVLPPPQNSSVRP